MEKDIERCVKQISLFDWEALDVLQVYLRNDWLYERYCNGPFYNILDTFKKSNPETQKILKTYVAFRKRKAQKINRKI